MKWQQVGPDGSVKSVDVGAQVLVPSARVYRTTAQPVTTATFNAIAFDTEHFDTDGIHDNVTNNTRLTCRTAGKYLVEGNVEFAGSTTGVRTLGVRVNNGAIWVQEQRPSVDVNTCAMVVSTTLDLAVGDYIELVVWQNTGSGLNVNASPYYSPALSMTYLGPGLVGSGSTPQWVTTLPSSAPHGTEVYLIVDATNGISWHLKYNAYSASAYKWEYLGGPPLSANADPDESTASGTPVDLTTVQSITMPRSGDYTFNFGTGAFNSVNAGGLIQSITKAGAQQMNAQGTPAAANQRMVISRIRNVAGVTAGEVFKAQYFVTTGTGQFGARWFQVTPIRLS